MDRNQGLLQKATKSYISIIYQIKHGFWPKFAAKCADEELEDPFFIDLHLFSDVSVHRIETYIMKAYVSHRLYSRT